jgi:hypothetical protein
VPCVIYQAGGLCQGTQSCDNGRFGKCVATCEDTTIHQENWYDFIFDGDINQKDVGLVMLIIAVALAAVLTFDKKGKYL